MPGDELILRPILHSTRAITIAAAPEAVWPWLVQMGQSRGGFYSYDWLENLAGLDIHNSDRIVPELQKLKVGDTIPFWRGAGVKVHSLIARQTLVLAGSLYGEKNDVGGTWVFAITPMDGGSTRLVVRSQIAAFPPQWLAWFLMHFLMAPMHFIMERRMMLTIKQRSEGLAAPS